MSGSNGGEGGSQPLDKHAKAKLLLLEEENKRLLARAPQRRNLEESAFDRRIADIERQKKKDVNKRKSDVNKIMTTAQQVDLLFLVDCTGSMAPYIREIKKKILSIVTQTTKSFAKLKIKLGFVGYRDFCDKDQRLVVLPFTTNVSAFEKFVGRIEASGGGDAPEDVFGGIDAATQMGWSQRTRIMIHIADAPCHGSRFQPRGMRDDYPLNAKGLDKNKLSASLVLSAVKEKNITYWFHHVNNKATDIMIREFNDIGQYHGFSISTRNLDEDVLTLAKHVVTSVTSSIGASITTDTRMFARPGAGVQRPRLVPNRPSWAKIKEENAVELYAPPPDSISKIVSNKDKLLRQKKIRLKVAPEPFARGAMRDAFYGTEMLQDSTQANVVMKRFDEQFRNAAAMNTYEIQMEIQSIAGFMAQEFNKKKKISGLTGNDVKFLDVRIVQMIDRPVPFFANVEPFIEAFEKYNNNAGYECSEIHDEVQAFSHWSFQESDQYFMIVDLQGMKTRNGYCLTDPALHCRDYSRFGATNLGVDGFQCFFGTHTCNRICKSLRLKEVDPRSLNQ